MFDFLEQLKHKKVLSRGDVAVLRNYIEKKHPNYDTSKKAVILADTIHKLIDKNLYGIDSEYKPEIRINVLKNTFLQNAELITSSDVFEACVSLENPRADYAAQLSAWLVHHHNIHADINQIEEILVHGITGKGKSPAMSVVPAEAICPEKNISPVPTSDLSDPAVPYVMHEILNDLKFLRYKSLVSRSKYLKKLFGIKPLRYAASNLYPHI